MRAREIASVLLFAAACGGGVATVDGAASSSSSSSSSSSGGSSSGSTGSTSSSSGGAGGDASTKDAARDANDPACPKTYGAPPGNCTVGLSCSYDEGRCECLGYCGGVPPPPDQDFSHWSCTAKRTDGCPDEKPAAGSACNVPTKFCDYGGCCIEQLVCGESGKWTSGGPVCPP